MAEARKGYQGHPKGDEFEENEPGQLGHHETPGTPNTCLCCGLVYFYLEPHCICAQGGNYWMQDELRRVTCFFHMHEKVKDGLFGSLPGEFAVPGGQPLYKPTPAGATPPVVGASQIKR